MTQIWVAGKDGSPDLIAHVQDLVVECHKLATEAAEARSQRNALSEELTIFREFAGGKCTIQKVIDTLGPLSLWSRGAITNVIGQRDKLAEALRRYGRHDSGGMPDEPELSCKATWMPGVDGKRIACTCGLDDALKIGLDTL